MLCLTRHVNEHIIMHHEGVTIDVQVQSVAGGRVTVGIAAPQSVRIDRGEIDAIRQKAAAERNGGTSGQ